MSEHQARLARDDVYDHEHEEPRSGRRRRPVADWGVGDDVFDHMPRSRFSRASEGPPRERRFASHEGAEAQLAEPAGPDEEAAPGRRDAPHRDEEAAPRRREALHRDEEAAPGRREAPYRDEPVRGVEDGRRTIVIDRPEDVPSEIAAVTADRDLGEVEDPIVAEHAPTPAPERRTVRIAGRPEGSLQAARFHREHGSRRPPRTAHERIGARPDRLAMWAVALGMLLILIAVLTAG